MLGLLLLSSLAGLASMAAWVSSNASPQQAAQPRTDPVATSTAAVIADRYVSGEPLQGIPVVEGVSFSSDGISVLSAPQWAGWNTQTIDGGTFERHLFDVYRQLNGEIIPYRISVLLSVDPSGGMLPALAAAPYVRRMPSAASGSPSDYRTRVDPQRTLPGAARERISLWAGAWASGDSEALKVLTGDPAAGVTYIGLGGYIVAGVSIISAVPVSAEDAWLARVRLVLEDPLLSGFSPSGHRMTVDLDVTVAAASSGNPRVVGWGAAGVGPRGPEYVREPVRP